MEAWRDELYHHGILGMKWGRKQGPPYPLGASDHSAAEKKAGYRKSIGGGRNEELYNKKKKKNAFSAKAAGHKVLAKVYEINEKTYAKSNKTLSSMNKSAKNDQLKKAEAAQKQANEKHKIKEQAAKVKKEEKEKAVKAKKEEKARKIQAYKDVDPSVAKNKQTRRVAYDYHNLTDYEFKRKYPGGKKKFAKRYLKTKGDTFSLGVKKAALAVAFIGSQPPRSVYIGKGKTLEVTGRKAVERALAYEVGNTIINTNFGYKQAEEMYNSRKNK